MKIAIYTGCGTTAETVQHIVYTLEQLYPYPQATLLKLNGFNIRSGLLNETVDLLVFPGGITTHMVGDLGKEGCKIVRQYVKNGGRYLGICAGAYLASKRVNFKTADQSIQKERPLRFFKGTCKGPLNGKFHIDNNVGAEIFTLYVPNQLMPIHSYMNGGGYFLDAHKKEGVKVLATFATGEAAIVKCKEGKGSVLLSAVHLEYQPHLLREISKPIKAGIHLMEWSHPMALAFLKANINALF